MAALAWHLGPPWWLVPLVLIGPDLAIAGYAAGPRTGAALYNAAHTYVGPALAAGAWLVLGNPDGRGDRARSGRSTSAPTARSDMA